MAQNRKADAAKKSTNSHALKRSADDQNLVDSTTEKAERAGALLAKKIIASLERELGL